MRESKEMNITITDTAEEERTRLMLSLTLSDKQFLRHYAADRNTSIAAIIHEWIEDHRADSINKRERTNV